MLSEELSWACRPLVEPIPFVEFMQCMDDLKVIIDEGKLSDLVAAMKGGGSSRGSRGEALKGAVKDVGSGIKKRLTGERGAMGRLSKLKDWLDDLKTHYPKAKFDNIMRHILEFGEKQPKETFKRVRKWAENSMVPSLEKRVEYSSNEARMAVYFHKKLAKILGL